MKFEAIRFRIIEQSLFIKQSSALGAIQIVAKIK
jgi:hypothetical protein